ncbi:MAG: phosphotransferase enzyme family protein [Candidatus Sericytochromatia bacterium]
MLSPEALAALEPERVREVAQRWHSEARLGPLLGDAENAVWRCEGAAPFVLRLTPVSHRSEAALRAELAWLAHLHQAEVAVCRPLLSQEGRHLEPLETAAGPFWASAFAWLEGAALTPADWREKHLEQLGKLAGHLHQQAQVLSPEQQAARPDWRQDSYFERVEALRPPDWEWLPERIGACREVLTQLSQDANHYGLIHGDLHRGNLFWQDVYPVVFDFDDCHLGWFAQDLAVMLYHSKSLTEPPPGADFQNWFLAQLKRGYERVMPWPALLNEALPWLLHWRDLQLLGFLLQRWPGGAGRPVTAQASLAQISQRAQTFASAFPD